MDPFLQIFVVVIGSAMALAVVGMVVLEIRRVLRSPESLIRQAEDLLDQGEFEEALSVVHQYQRRTDIDDWQGLLLKAHALHGLGERDEAWALLEKVRALPDKTLLMRGVIGLVLIRINRLREAYEELTHARDIDPEDTFVLMAWTQAAISTGRCRLANDVLKKHVNDHPDDVEILRIYGLTLLEHGRSDDAVVQLRDVMRREPEDLLTLAYYARALAETGDLPAARRELNLGLAADANHFDLLLADADLTCLEGDGDTAVQRTKALESHAEADKELLCGSLAGILLGCGRFSDVLAETERLTQDHGPTAAALSARMHVFILRSEHERVQREFEQAPAELREDATVLTEYARSLNNQGRHKEAIAYLDEAVEKTPLEAYALYSRAFTFHRMGRLDDAKRGYERHLDVACDSVTTLTGLAQIAIEQGRKDEAGSLCEEAAQLAERLTDDSLPKALIATRAYSASFGFVLRHALNGDEADAVRAIELLDKGIQSGDFGPEDLLMDPDLEPFQDRDDFKTMLKKLEKNVQG